MQTWISSEQKMDPDTDHLTLADFYIKEDFSNYCSFFQSGSKSASKMKWIRRYKYSKYKPESEKLNKSFV